MGGGAEVRWSNAEDGREVLRLPHTSAVFYDLAYSMIAYCAYISAGAHVCVRACMCACVRMVGMCGYGVCVRVCVCACVGGWGVGGCVCV